MIKFVKLVLSTEDPKKEISLEVPVKNYFDEELDKAIKLLVRAMKSKRKDIV